MDKITGDLCRSSDLTESVLLSSMEDRYKDNLTESYVGNVLLRLSHASTTSSPLPSSQILPLFCSSVVHSLASPSQDQCVLLCGRQSAGKYRLVTDTLSDLLLPLDDPDNRAVRISSGMRLLTYLCSSSRHGQQALTATTLLVDPSTSTLKGAHFSLCLLNTTELSSMQVFDGGVTQVCADLQVLGLSPSDCRDVEELLEGVAALVAGGEVAAILKDLGVRWSSTETLVSSDKLAQLLYAYLVHWIVLWLNSVCGSEDPRAAWISLLSSPGHSGQSQETTKLHGQSELSSLILTCADELLHNIYCTRLFVWEQEQYSEEGLNWEPVEVDSNEELVNAIQQDGGLLDALSSSTVPELLEGVADVCHNHSDACFLVGGALTLVHLTGESTYRVSEDWLVDNESHVAGNAVQALLRTSRSSLLVQLAQNMRFSPDHVLASEPVEQCLLSQRAKFCMDAISDILTTSSPHFVISLEPDLETASCFHSEVVLQQVQQFKVLDTAIMQSCGYPVRLKHQDFLKRYGLLLPLDLPDHLTVEDRCERILQEAELKDFHIGRISVLLKPWHLGELDCAVELYNLSARKLQHALRRSLMKKKGHLSSPNISLQEPLDLGKENLCSQANQENAPPIPPPRPSHTYSEKCMNSFVPPVEESSDADYHCRAVDPSPGSPAETSPGSNRKRNSWKNKRNPNSIHKESSSSDLKSQVWFLGPLSREKAEEYLKPCPTGTFMIRESQKRLGEYSLSLSHDGTVKHFRVDTKGTSRPRFQLYGAQRSFSTLPALVEHYSQLCISPRGELLTTAYSPVPEVQAKPLKRKLTSIHRSQPTASGLSPGSSGKLQSKPKSKSCDMTLNLESMVAVERQLEVEQRIVEAARRMAEMPTGTRRERQKRKQSLQMAQSKLMSLRQEYHILKQKNLFIQYSMHPVLDEPTILQ